MKTEFSLAELYRLILNLIRKGVVTEVDTKNWQCRVQIGDLETNWLNWLTLRAGKSRTWWKPSVGEQVLVLAVGGELTTAFVLPGIYSDACPPPSTSEDAMVTAFPDGGWIEYEPETGRYRVKAGTSIIFDAPESIAIKTALLDIDADQTVINGEVTQNGGALSSNDVVLDAHAHIGVIKGGDKTGGPV
nr:phage baseplate assembly protein V [Atlantibacter hermannii]